MYTPVSEFKTITIDYALTFPTGAPGAAALRFYTNPPSLGPALSLSRTVSLPASTRTTATFDLDSSGLPEGTLYRVRIDTIPAGGVLKVYKAWVTRRPLGCYLTAGQSWQSPENDAGFELPNLFREVEISGQLTGTPASATVAWFAELSGQSVAQTYTATFANTAARDTWNVRLPGNTKGHLYRAKISCVQGTMKLFGVRAFVRSLGGPFPWHWIALPVPATPDDWLMEPMQMKATPEQPEWLDLGNDVT